jgi:hypothetical protein
MFYIHSLMSMKKRIRISFAVVFQRMNKCLPLANVISLKAGEIVHQRLCKYSSKSVFLLTLMFLSLSVWLCWVVCILRECGLTASCLLKTQKGTARNFIDFQNNVDTSSPKSRFVLPPIWRYDAPFVVLF